MVDDPLKEIEKQLYKSMNEESKEDTKVKVKKEEKTAPKKEISKEVKAEKKEKPTEKEKKPVKKIKKKKQKRKIKKKIMKKQAKKIPKKKTVKKKVKRKKKFKIKNYIIPIASFLVILIIVLVFKFTVFNDTVVAYVNGKPIYLSEIEMRHALYQGVYSKEEFLNQSILEEMLLQEAQKQGFSVTDDEFNEMMDLYLQSYNLTKGELDNQLKELGSSYKEFEKSSRERVIINLLLESVLANVTVTEEEMKDYYNEVKEDLPENVTYEDVKDLVNQSILLNKQDELFAVYVDDLKKEYDIVVYWDLVKEKEEVIDKKTELAKCLTANAVKMYGSTTCSASLTQKNMFGDAVEFLNIVECDQEGKQECEDMAIKATPTWVVNNIKYTGVLSLEGLAELAGCEY